MGKVWKEGGDENILKLNSSGGCYEIDFDNGCTAV